MRKLKACIHIKAPHQTVQSLASSERRNEWMPTHSSLLHQTVRESWELKSVEGGTLFTLLMEFRSRLPLADFVVGDQIRQAVSRSLSRLKQIAEASGPPQ